MRRHPPEVAHSTVLREDVREHLVARDPLDTHSTLTLVFPKDVISQRDVLCGLKLARMLGQGGYCLVGAQKTNRTPLFQPKVSA